MTALGRRRRGAAIGVLGLAAGLAVGACAISVDGTPVAAPVPPVRTVACDYQAAPNAFDSLPTTVPPSVPADQRDAAREAILTRAAEEGAKRALADVGYETPSPIQAATIPLVLEGRDVVGLAQTGTGKTAAFAVPVLSKIDGDALAAEFERYLRRRGRGGWGG